MAIATQAECDAALLRIVALSGDPEGSAGDGEMSGLIDAVNAFRLPSATPASTKVAPAVMPQRSRGTMPNAVAIVSDDASKH